MKTSYEKFQAAIFDLNNAADDIAEQEAIQKAYYWFDFAQLEEQHRIADALEKLASCVGPAFDKDESPPVFWIGSID